MRFALSDVSVVALISRNRWIDDFPLTDNAVPDVRVIVVRPGFVPFQEIVAPIPPKSDELEVILLRSTVFLTFPAIYPLSFVILPAIFSNISVEVTSNFTPLVTATE